ncbi:agmatinase [Salinigranum rubrum]|uniref:Agmatinase n=2 Tax=Salinigranum rubrum TaxID=755307 RepID=A0A2I8VMK0_9EURY|nr:agmatinase [Salinigranum rubrum]AUV82319.1 agmatinase [Salinigranum rubrum]
MMDERTETRAEAFRDRTTGASVELPYAGIDTFLKSEIRSPSDVEGADAAVLGVPYDGAVSNRPGARYGPGAIREASAWWAYLSGYKGGLTNMRTGRTVDFDALDLVDCGDVPVFPMDRETTAESITAHVATVAAQGTMPVLLGGDHYCTFPSVTGFVEGVDADRVGVVQIDAHTDTVAESPVFGEHFHGSSTHHVADSAFCDYEHVAQVGIRGYESPAFFEFAEETGLSLYTGADIEERGIAPVIEEAVDSVSEGADAVYVTFDIDAVDPSVAPGTGTPEPGGLSAAEALTVMEVLGARTEVGAVDLMEVAPTYDPTEGTQRLAAYLLVTFLERQFAA